MADRTISIFDFGIEQIKAVEGGDAFDHTVGSDMVSLADNVYVSLTDIGAGADMMSLQPVGLSISDTGNGAEAVFLQPVSMGVFDFGIEQIKAVEGGDAFDHTVGSDMVSLVGAVSITDAGNGADQVSAQGGISIADSGSGADGINQVAKAYFVIDSYGILHPLNMTVLWDSRYDLLPGTRDNAEEIPGRHGEIDFGSELGPRTLEIHVASKEEFDPKQREQIKRTLAAYLNPLLGVRTLIFADDIEKTYQVKYAGKIDLNQYVNWMTFTIPFKASDPFIIGTWEKQRAGNGTLTNEGTVETPLVIEITGPVASPSVMIGGEALSYTGTLAEGDKLVIDTDKMTVAFNGVNAIANYSGGFPKLQPGETAVTAAAAGTTTWKWRDRWI
jgi:predicted phage tail component-like protein